MLLSIVECGDHKEFSIEKKQSLRRREFGDDVEIIGPITAKNVAAMRNKGGQQARGQWIFFKDQDCTVRTEDIVKAIRKIQKSSRRFGAISGVYRNECNSTMSRAYNFIQRHWVLRGLNRSIQESGLHSGIHLLGGAMLVRREAFQDVNGFSEEIGWGGEELDFTHRLRSMGYSTGVSFCLKVTHGNKVDFFGFLKRAWFQNFNRTYFLKADQADERRGSVFSYFQNSLNLPPVVLFFTVAKIASLAGLLSHGIRVRVRYRFSNVFID